MDINVLSYAVIDKGLRRRSLYSFSFYIGGSQPGGWDPLGASANVQGIKLFKLIYYYCNN